MLLQCNLLQNQQFQYDLKRFDVFLVGFYNDLKCFDVFLVGFYNDLRCFEVFRSVFEVL